MNNNLAVVMKSGKYVMGYKSVVRTLRSGRAKLLLVAANCAPIRKYELEYYSMLSATPMDIYSGCMC